MSKKISIEQLEDELLKDIAALRNGVADKIQQEVIDNAPSESGTLRGNINLYINDEQGQYDESSKDPSGIISKSENSSKAKSSKNPNDTLRIVSEAPYSLRIEFEGHSGQAPSGFVRVAVENAKTIAKSLQNKLGEYR